MSAATDEEMRAAVEQWARARGLVMHGRDGYERWSGGRWGLHVNPLPPRSTLLVCQNGDELLGTEVSPHAALVWALVLEARPLRDGTRCKRCRGRGTWDEWREQAFAHPSRRRRRRVIHDAGQWIAGMQAAGWQVVPNYWAGEVSNVRAFRTCPCVACLDPDGPTPLDTPGSGLVDLTDAYAQHVLDVQTRVCDACSGVGSRWRKESDGWIDCEPCCGLGLRPPFEGRRTSIEALHIFADRLQRDGDPLGLDIAHMLAGSREGTDDAVARLRALTPQAQAEPGQYSISVDGLPAITVAASSGASSAEIAGSLAAQWNASTDHRSRGSVTAVDGNILFEPNDTAPAMVASFTPITAPRTAQRSRPGRRISSKRARFRF